MPDPTRDAAPPDEELLARVRAGDREWFGPLVRRYERELYGYLRRYVGDADLAEDVFQNTFTQVFVKIDQYEPGRPARPWIYAIATNQAIDAMRKRARRSDAAADPTGGDPADADPKPLAELAAAPGPSPHEQADRAEEAGRVRAAVDRLPDLLRQVLLLAYFQGLPYRDVADALGIPVGTVKSRLHAALVKFQEVWAEAGGGGEIGDGPAAGDRPGDRPPPPAAGKTAAGGRRK